MIETIAQSGFKPLHQSRQSRANGSFTRPIGKYASVSQAARELRMTRQSVKAMFREVDKFETDQNARVKMIEDRP